MIRYYPFEGKYSTAPGLHPLSADFGNGAHDQRIFQLDEGYTKIMQNKQRCRQENIRKYYQYHEEKLESLRQIQTFVIEQLLATYPEYFQLIKEPRQLRLTNQLTRTSVCYDDHHTLTQASPYLSLLDALADQIPEDVAIWQRAGDQDYLSTIHLCAPNHWSPAAKVGQPFGSVHAPVAGMEAMRRRYQPMLKSLIKGGSYVRFAWGLGTDNRLNHHPEPPADYAPEAWQGRNFDPAHPQLFVRIERQTLTGFPAADAVLFTIRTYFLEVRALPATHLNSLIRSLQGMSAETLAYKGLRQDQEKILHWLAHLIGQSGQQVAT